MMFRIALCTFLASFPALFSARAQAQQSSPTKRTLNANADVVLFDAPYNSSGLPRYPSMSQSLSITKTFYEVSHGTLEQRIDPYEDGWQGFFNRLAFVGFDVLTMSLPPASAWMHEEWHRAVMGNRNIDSHNGVYNLKGGSTIPVDRVTDEDLIRLKEESNADFVRLSTAGMESEHQLALAVEKDHFFRGTRTFDYPALALFKMSPALYVGACSGSESNRITDESNDEDGADIPKRDFTGLDCNAWMYDLQRPDEPYSARGTHPSGVGINRYRKFSDLSKGEKDFLRLQSQLTWLNLVDPFIFGYESFGSSPWNANLGHDLTPFGYTVDVNLFRTWPMGAKSLATLHVFRNGVRSFPGFDFERQVSPAAAQMMDSRLLSYRFGIWQQPKGLRFDTAEGTLGGLIGAKFRLLTVREVDLYTELLHKTQGWVPGVVKLDHGTNVQVGVRTLVF